MHREIIGVEDGRGSKDRGSVMKRRGGVSQAGWSLEQRLKRAGDIARIGENGTEKLGQGANWEIDSLRDAVDRFEEEYLRKLHGMLNGNVSRVALEPGISRQTLYTKFKRHGIDPA